jgi:hypothetical protein
VEAIYMLEDEEDLSLFKQDHREFIISQKLELTKGKYQESQKTKTTMLRSLGELAIF